MKHEGNIPHAIEYFESGINRNLYALVQNRFAWMNEFIVSTDVDLEVGCGAGFSKQFIKAKNFKICDFSDYEFLDYKNVDALNTGFDSETYDFVVNSNMIHHVPYPVLFLEEMHRILKKGGRLIIQDINCSLVTKLSVFLMRHEGFDFTANVFDTNNPCTDENDLWSANIAIPNLLFDDVNKFQILFGKYYDIIHHSYDECLTFINSGGVIAKTRHIPMRNSVLKRIHKIDKIITNAFPRLFAMQRKIVLVKT